MTVLYGIAVILMAAGMLGLSYALGERRDSATQEPYESGMASTGSARLRFSAHFYLVAMLFVIFDLEAAFLFVWAVSLRELGWAGYAGALGFLVILSVGLFYEWRVGALDWGAAPVVRRGRGGPTS